MAEVCHQPECLLREFLVGVKPLRYFETVTYFGSLLEAQKCCLARFFFILGKAAQTVVGDWPSVQQLQNTSSPASQITLACYLFDKRDVTYVSQVEISPPEDATFQAAVEFAFLIENRLFKHLKTWTVNYISATRLAQLKVNPASWLANAVKFTRSVLPSAALNWARGLQQTSLTNCFTLAGGNFECDPDDGRKGRNGEEFRVLLVFLATCQRQVTCTTQCH